MRRTARLRERPCPSAARQSSPAVRRNWYFVTLGVLSQNGRLQRSTDRIRAADPAEKRLDVVDDGVLDEGRTGLLRRVVDEDTEVFPEQRIADGGFDANNASSLRRRSFGAPTSTGDRPRPTGIHTPSVFWIFSSPHLSDARFGETRCEARLHGVPGL